MKKFIKYSLYGLIYLFIVFILAIIFMNSAKAELVKPNNSLEPHQVVKIQLRGLKYNDEPKKDNGIEQTWEFAHPYNKRYTGPLPKFINMIKSENYKIMASGHQGSGSNRECPLNPNAQVDRGAFKSVYRVLFLETLDSGRFRGGSRLLSCLLTTH